MMSDFKMRRRLILGKSGKNKENSGSLKFLEPVVRPLWRAAGSGAKALAFAVRPYHLTSPNLLLLAPSVYGRQASRYRTCLEHWFWRPRVPPLKDPKAWFRYAGAALPLDPSTLFSLSLPAYADTSVCRLRLMHIAHTEWDSVGSQQRAMCLGVCVGSEQHAKHL